MISDQLEATKRHKNYYRNNLRKMVNALMFLTLIVLFLTILILYRFFTLPAPYYYATASNGQLTQLLTVPKNTGLVQQDEGQ